MVTSGTSAKQAATDERRPVSDAAEWTQGRWGQHGDDLAVVGDQDRFAILHGAQLSSRSTRPVTCGRVDSIIVIPDVDVMGRLPRAFGGAGLHPELKFRRSP